MMMMMVDMIIMMVMVIILMKFMTKITKKHTNDCWTIPPAGINDSGESAGHVHVGQGGLDLPGSEGGGRKEGGGDAVGGGDEEGAESTVDGIIGWTRVGKKGQLP